MRIGCLEYGDFIFIKITTLESDCGTFNINVNAINDCDIANDCEDISEAQTLYPVTDDEDIIYVCTSGCIDLACPNPEVTGGCDFSNSPTIWYKIVVDDDAAQLFTTVSSVSGNWQPVWSVYYGDCDSTFINASSGNTPPCSNGDNSPDLHQIGVDSGIDTYYLVVTYDPADPPPPEDTEIEVCVGTLVSVIVCMGDIGDNCELDPTVKIMVTDRQYAFNEPIVDPEVGYMGPFYPGEEVQGHIEFFYDGTESGADWLIGFIPDFGPGWDMDGHAWDDYPPSGTPAGAGEWHKQDTPCAPIVAESFPFLCTYTDSEGKLHICNELCEACNCEKPYMDPYDPLPGGYFWLTNGSNSGCVANSCQPHQRWGIGSTTSFVTWDFTAKVKPFNNQINCYSNDDLQITFQTFSDGGAGCWEYPVGECLIDRKQLGPLWEVACTLPSGVFWSNTVNNIISGDSLALNISTDDGSKNQIIGAYEDNPHVEGETEHIFYSGQGIINDVLTLTDTSACEPEIVRYYSKVYIPGFACTGETDTFEVIVNPTVKIVNDNLTLCKSDLPFVYQIHTDYENSDSLKYYWENGELGLSDTTNIISIPDTTKPGTYTFDVSITDEMGCLNIGNVTLNITKDFKFSIQGDTLCWGEEKIFTPELYGSYSSEFNYKWYWPSGKGPSSSKCYYNINMDSYNGILVPGKDQICLEISRNAINQNICKQDTCFDIYIKASIDTSITKSGNTLVSNEENAGYQWIDCFDGNKKIEGETNQSFTPSEDGSYSVEINKYGCIDTSNCQTVIISGIIENTFGNDLKIYPNPTNGMLNIDFIEVLQDIEINVYNPAGQKIDNLNFKNKSYIGFDIDAPAGMYLMEIKSSEKRALVKVVKE